MSDLVSYYESARATEQIKRDVGLASDVDERTLFTTDDKAYAYVNLSIQNYPYWQADMPTDITKSNFWDDFVRYNKGKRVLRDIREGNKSELNAIVGLGDEGEEATGLEKFENLIKQPAEILYLYGVMDSGKSFFASLATQIFADWVKSDDSTDDYLTIEQAINILEETAGIENAKGELEARMSDDDFETEDISTESIVGSNLSSLEGSTYVDCIEDLLTWLKQDEDIPKLFVFDEASLYANSLSMSNTQKVYASLLPLIIVIRRYGGRVILIGHSGSDLGRQIRELADVAYKDSKRKVSFFDTIDDTGNPEDKMFSLYQTPEMLSGADKEGLVPDTNDKGAWDWREEDKELVEAELAGFDEIEDDVEFPEESNGEDETDSESDDGVDFDDLSRDEMIAYLYYVDDDLSRDEMIAYLYYVDDDFETQEEIADELDVSSTTVSRALDK